MSNRHQWSEDEGAKCARCGMNREQAGDGMYGAMRYFYDPKHVLPRAGPCPGLPPRTEPAGGASA